MQTGLQTGWEIYALAAALGVVYAAAVALWRRHDPSGSNTAFMVVIGDGMVAAFVGLIWGLEVAASLVALLALMGVPQIVGYHVDHVLLKQDDEKRETLEL